MASGIDAVVMWVDGSDPTFRASRNHYLRLQGDDPSTSDGEGRHRDNGELRYALRGIEYHLPWIDRIFLVTNGQRPNWIDFGSERIRLVSHDDVFPAHDLLPTFNSLAIDACIHRIPGLSETFIRFSDDFFACRPIAFDDLFRAPNSIGRVQLGSRILLPGQGKSFYDRQLANNASLIFGEFGFFPRHNFLHVPQIRTIELSELTIETWKDAFAATRGHRFRSIDDVIMLFLYPYIALANSGESSISMVDGKVKHPDVRYPGVSVARQIQVGNNAKPWRDILRRAVESPPEFLNLNDAFGASADDNDRQLVSQCLQELFPNPSSFEL